MPLPPPSRKRSVIRRLLLQPLAAILIAASPAEEIPKPDVFDVLGASPAGVAASTIQPSRTDNNALILAGLATLPMSPTHRAEFIAALKQAIQSSTIARETPLLCLIDLLEADGRHDEAIAIIRATPNVAIAAGIRQIALLWKAGRPGEAAALAKEIAKPTHNPVFWLDLVQNDLNQGRPQDASRLLDFLHTLDSIPPLARFWLATQHLEIARQQGNIDALIDSTPHPVLRAVWCSLLGRTELQEQAIQQCNPDDPAAMALLTAALGSHPVIDEKLKALLANPELSLAQRRTILNAIPHPNQRFDHWAAMPSSHAETADVLTPLNRSGILEEDTRILATSTAFMEANPQSILLKWWVANLHPNHSPAAVPLLREVARDLQEINPATGLFANPALGALEKLAAQAPPEPLRDLVTQAHAFAKLSIPARLTYLIAANLDAEVLTLLPDCRFEEPAFDPLAGNLEAFVSRRATTIPEAAITPLIDRLPEIILGSTEKSTALIQSHTRSWLTCLGTQSTDEPAQARAIQNLIQSAAKRSPDLPAQLLPFIPEFAWKLPNLDLEKPDQNPTTRPTAKTSPAYLTLSVFTPPRAAMIGQGPQAAMLARGAPFPGQSGIHPFISILAESPWSQNIRDMRWLGPPDPAKFATLAKLRSLLENDPARTLIYDLLVAFDQIQCPAPAIKSAAGERIAALDPAQLQDPALVFFLFYQRLTKGTPVDDCLPLLDHLRKFLRPALQQACWRGIASASQTSETVRARIHQLVPRPLATPPPRDPTPPPAKKPEPDPYDRLQLFIEAGKTSLPECTALAREVLFKFIDSNQPATTPTENIAIAVLSLNEQFQIFLTDLQARMTGADRSELEIQRALFRLHRYRSVHRNNEAEPFALRIFALDPSDTEVLPEVLAAAVREKDSATTLNILQLHCQRDPDLFNNLIAHQSSGLLALFTGPQARQLSEMLLKAPSPPPRPASQSPGSNHLHPLFAHIAQHDPENLMPILRWSGALASPQGSELRLLANTLQPHLPKEEIIKLLADALFTPPTQDPIQNVRPPAGPPPPLPSRDALPLDAFIRDGFAKPLAEAAADYPPSRTTAGIKVLFQLAADPTPETWQGVVPDFIASLPIATRESAIRQLMEHTRLLPDATALQYHVAIQAGSTLGPLRLSSIIQNLNLAAEINQRAEVANFWTAAKSLLPAESPANQISYLAQATTAIAILAEDDVWQEFLRKITDTEGFAEHWVGGYSN